jgi:prepilin-type N-terminal cleavage/methylation domain-containing protein
VKRQGLTRLRQSGFTLLELMVSLAAGLVALAVLIEGSVAVQKSLAASDQFSFRTNNGNRIADAVPQDLRLAVGVGTLDGSGNYTKLSPSSAPLTIGSGLTDPNTLAIVTSISTLAITIPDYYGSNVPDNSVGSAYKTTRYPRSTLNTGAAYNGNSGSAAVLNGVVPWAQAVTTVTNTTTTAFASTGTGLIQVRYTQGPRSAADATPCYFRTEYPSNSNTPNSAPVEIADDVVDSDSMTTLIIIDPDYGTAADAGTHFRIQSNFTPRYRFISNTYSINQFVDVYLRNPRRD